MTPINGRKHPHVALLARTRGDVDRDEVFLTRVRGAEGSMFDEGEHGFFASFGLSCLCFEELMRVDEGR